mgnify:CR=1 FL=1
MKNKQVKHLSSPGAFVTIDIDDAKKQQAQTIIVEPSFRGLPEVDDESVQIPQTFIKEGTASSFD